MVESSAPILSEFESIIKAEPDLIIERPGVLYLGNQKHANNMEILKKYGIQVVLQITGDETVPPHGSNFEYHRFVFEDRETVEIMEHLIRAIGIIEKCHKEGKKVFVHCAAGISRSASFVIAYVMKAHQLAFPEALKLVHRQRPCIGPNEGFKKTLAALQFN
ncbi:hypothetical protein FGO68_gene10980 [Halteria grandinella]|uniref:protein-tyrosine-phosphatase n=1 Tax=Halteria grandinella TaxID=5974 RepID=A0A8J8NIR9_HALGN|nr:hypothetical protein FGO68_gene10980 [Halteria grandinella]